MPQLLTHSQAPSALTSSAIPNRPLRLAYFVSHPIQYQAPLLRRIAQEPDIDLRVFFSSDLSVRGYLDPGFGVRVQWDTPLLDGYQYEFLPRLRDSERVAFAEPLNWGITRRLVAGHFDAVWVMGYSNLFTLNAVLSANLLRMPVLMRTDSNLQDRERSPRTLALKKLFAALLKPAVTAIVSVGTLNEDYWKHYFGDRFPIFRMPYAVDNDYFRGRCLAAAPRREELRRELGLDPSLPVILFASKLQTRKRCIDLLEAFIRLAPAPSAQPPAELLIVGDGEQRAALEARAREAGLTRARFLGFRNQSELPRFFDLCDLFVLPSIHEPWALIVNEVMIAGRPVIVSDQVGCHPDLVRNGYNGFVYPAQDIDALAACLRQLIDNPTLRASMGQNSLSLVQTHTFEHDIAGLRRALAAIVPGFTA